MSKPEPPFAGTDKALKAARDNRSRQLNPKDREFRRSRGLEDRPGNSGGQTPPGPRKS